VLLAERTIAANAAIGLSVFHARTPLTKWGNLPAGEAISAERKTHNYMLYAIKYVLNRKFTRYNNAL
jgi:hypothetical protein